MSDQTLEQLSVDFDALTFQMAAIHGAADLAPLAHKPVHEEAWASAYGRATDLLVANPEFARSLMAMGATALSGAQVLVQEKVSLSQIKHYQEAGLVEHVSVTPSEEVVKNWETAQATLESAIFLELFGANVPAAEPEQHIDDHDIEDAEEYQDDPNEINTLDVIEMLAESDYSPAEQAAIAFMLHHQTLGVTDLRKEVWEIITMSKKEFDSFAKRFRSFGFGVAAYLTSAGIPARLEFVQKPKDNARLLIGGEAEVIKDHNNRAGLEALYGKGVGQVAVRPERETKTTELEPQEKIHELVAEVASTPPGVDMNDILELARNIITEHPYKEKPRLTAVGRTLADAHGITHAEACGIIKQLVDEGSLFYGRSHKGSRTIALEPPAMRPEADKDRAAKKAVEADNFLTSEDLELTGRIFDALVDAGHQNKGLTMRSLSLGLVIEPDALKPCLNKLADCGVLIKEVGWERSRSAHSRKKQATFFRFRDQQAWLDFKANPSVFVKSLLP